MFENQFNSILSNLDEVKTSSTVSQTFFQHFKKQVVAMIQKSEHHEQVENQVKDHLAQINLLLENINSTQETESIKKKIQKLVQQLFNLELVQALNLNLTGISELHLNYHIGDLIILPTTAPNATLCDWMSRDISKLHSTIEKIGNVIRITQGPRKHVGLFKNKVILFLPLDYTGFITIRNESDQIYGANLQSNCMVDITSIAGNVLLNNFHVKRLQADLTSGNILLTNCLAQDIHVNTHSGNITAFNVKDTKFDAETLLTSTSGNIKLDNFSTNRLVIDTKSGNIRAKALSKSDCDFSTLSGNIKISNLINSGNIRSNTGKIKLSINSKFNDTLKVKTTLGSIKIKVADNFPLQFHAKGELAAITLPLDAIIFDNSNYDKIDGYLIDEKAPASMYLESEHGTIDVLTKN